MGIPLIAQSLPQFAIPRSAAADIPLGLGVRPGLTPYKSNAADQQFAPGRTCHHSLHERGSMKAPLSTIATRISLPRAVPNT